MRDRESQIREDLAVRAEDHARSFELEARVLDEYGSFIASLAPWTHFVTLTHDPRRLAVGHTIVGASLHREKVRAWVGQDIRHFARGAKWWSETELHKSGQAHEHGLLAAPDSAALLSLRTRWYERAGFAYLRPISDHLAAAKYVAKYTGKAGALEPTIFGLFERRLLAAALKLATTG